VDPYKILEVTPGASKEEIKSAYKKKALIHHPDQGGSEEEFKKVTDAYKTLINGNPKMPPVYGTRTESPVYRTRTEPPIFIPNDIEITISLDLSDVINGAHKKYKIKKNIECSECAVLNICSTCQGLGFISASPDVPFMDIKDCYDCSGKGFTKLHRGCSHCGGAGQKTFNDTIEVFIRKGSFIGMKYKLAQKGAVSSKGIKGDIVIIIGSIKATGFIVKGLDIYGKIKIPFFDLVLGGEVEMPLPNGKTITRSVAPGTLPGSTLVLEKEGMPKIVLDNYIRGDYLAEIEVEIPEISGFSSDKIEKLKAVKDLWNLTF